MLKLVLNLKKKLSFHDAVQVRHIGDSECLRIF